MKNLNTPQFMIFIFFTLDYFLFDKGESKIETCAFWIVIILYNIWVDVSLINKNTEK